MFLRLSNRGINQGVADTRCTPIQEHDHIDPEIFFNTNLSSPDKLVSPEPVSPKFPQERPRSFDLSKRSPGATPAETLRSKSSENVSSHQNGSDNISLPQRGSDPLSMKSSSSSGKQNPGRITPPPYTNKIHHITGTEFGKREGPLVRERARSFGIEHAREIQHRFGVGDQQAKLSTPPAGAMFHWSRTDSPHAKTHPTASPSKSQATPPFGVNMGRRKSLPLMRFGEFAGSAKGMSRTPPAAGTTPRVSAPQHPRSNPPTSPPPYSPPMSPPTSPPLSPMPMFSPPQSPPSASPHPRLPRGPLSARESDSNGTAFFIPGIEGQLVLPPAGRVAPTSSVATLPNRDSVNGLRGSVGNLGDVEGRESMESLEFSPVDLSMLSMNSKSSGESDLARRRQGQSREQQVSPLTPVKTNRKKSSSFDACFESIETDDRINETVSQSKRSSSDPTVKPDKYILVNALDRVRGDFPIFTEHATSDDSDYGNNSKLPRDWDPEWSPLTPKSADNPWETDVRTPSIGGESKSSGPQKEPLSSASSRKASVSSCAILHTPTSPHILHTITQHIALRNTQLKLIKYQTKTFRVL